MLKLVLAPLVMLTYGLVGLPRDAVRSWMARRRLRASRPLQTLLG
jgi:hypothetical protein